MVGRVLLPPATTIVNCFVSLPATFAALTVKLDAPAAVGVPQINPFVSNVKPAGRLPLVIDQVIGVDPFAKRYWL